MLTRLRLPLTHSLLLAVCALLTGGVADAQDLRSTDPSSVTKLTGNDRPVLLSVQLQPGGDLVAAAGDDHRIYVWDRSEDRLQWRLEGHRDWVRSLSISPDGRWLVSGGNDGRVLLWNLADGTRHRELLLVDAAIRCVQFSHSGAMTAVAAFGEPLRVLDVATGETRFELVCPCQDIGAVGFGKGDVLLAASGRNGRVRVWNLHEQAEAIDYRPHRRRVRDLVILDDNAVISCGDDGRVVRRSEDNRDAEEVARVETKLFSLAAINNSVVAVGGADNRVRIVNLSNGSVEQAFDGHEGTVADICTRGGVLATCGFDASVRMRPLDGVVGNSQQNVSAAATHESETNRDSGEENPLVTPSDELAPAPLRPPSR